MNQKIKDAIELCEEYGWEISRGKWFLVCENTNDRVIFNTDKEFIEYAKLLKGERKIK